MEDKINIFILDEDPAKAAQYHCDKHVVKMILEVGQMLCTAHRELDGVDTLDSFETGEPYHIVELYKSTHKNHPCAKWIRESVGNYHWAFIHFRNLGMEYQKRYGRNHKTHEKYWWHLGMYPNNIPGGTRTPFAQAMPDEYKDPDAVKAYRAYYIGAKSDIAKWNHSETPEWWPHV